MPEDDRPTGTTEEPTGTTTDETVADGSVSEADGSGSGTAPEDEVTRLKNANAQLLSEKTGWQKRIEELEQKVSAPPPATGDSTKLRELYERDLQLEREILNGVEPTMAHLQALTRLRMYTEAKAEQQARQVERKVEVVRLPEDLQGEVEKLAQEEGISVKLAARILKAERAVQAKANATETDEERTARLKAKRDATPATISRAVTADEAGARSMTRADYNRRLSEFDEADDIRGKMAFVKKKQEGKIKLRD